MEAFQRTSAILVFGLIGDTGQVTAESTAPT
jgi:hypothetical protein